MKRVLLICLLAACLVSGGFIVWGAGGDFYVIPVRQAAVPEGTIIMWSGEIDPNGHPIIKGKPDTRWHVCDGTDGTPDLTGRFAMGAHPAPGGGWNIGVIGGSPNVTLDILNLPSHTHEIGGQTGHDTPPHIHRSAQRDYFLDICVDPLKSGTCAGCTAVPCIDYTDYGMDFYDTSAPTHAHFHSLPEATKATGSGHAINTLPPYYSLVFLMYTGA